jgi:N-acetyltransferase
MNTSPFEQPAILEDSRVQLLPLEMAHYEHLLPFALNEPGTWYYSMINPAGAEGMRRYIEHTLDARTKGMEYPFIVFDKQTNTWAGSTRFYDIQQAHLTAQLGYTWYGEAFRRTGLNRHCKLLLLTYAFEQWGLERVEFRADANNSASVNAMKAIGCVEEGILRSHAIVEGRAERRTSMILSILKEEWFGGVKAALTAKTK